MVTQKISVAFGLSKERFYDEDFNYENPEGADLPSDVVKENHPAYQYSKKENAGE